MQDGGNALVGFGDVSQIVMAIKGNNISDCSLSSDGAQFNHAWLIKIIDAIKDSTDFQGDFTIHQATLVLSNVDVKESFARRYDYIYIQGGAEKRCSYDFFDDCDAKDLLKTLPSVANKLSLKCDIRFSKFHNGVMYMKIGNVTEMTADLEDAPDSEFNALVATAIHKFASLKELRLKCSKYIKNVMDAVEKSCSIDKLDVDCGANQYGLDFMAIKASVSRALNVGQVKVLNGGWPVDHDHTNRRQYLPRKAAIAWLRHKDSDYFTAREIAYFYKYRNIIKYTAQSTHLWTQKDVDSFEQEISKRIGSDTYVNMYCRAIQNSDQYYDVIPNELMDEIKKLVTEEGLRKISEIRVDRICSLINSISVTNRLITKRSLSNMLMVESALMLWIVNVGGNVSFTPIIINLAVVAADSYRARRKVSLQDWEDSEFDKGYDIVMASMSGVSFGMWSIGGSILMASYAIEDLSEKVEGFAVFCVALYAVLHAAQRSVVKYNIEKDGRGVEENIYVSLATATISNFVILAATDSDTIKLKLGLQAAVLGCVYAYDKYQDKIYRDQIRSGIKDIDL